MTLIQIGQQAMMVYNTSVRAVVRLVTTNAIVRAALEVEMCSTSRAAAGYYVGLG